MSDAPERIWIDDERSIGGELTVFIDEPSCLEIDVYNDLYNTKYIRADRIEELEAKLADAMEERDEWQSLAEAAITDDAAKNIHYAEIQAKLAKAVKIIAAAKEMYETAMLTGGGSSEAWVNHVRARNAFASTLAELSSVSCANSKGQDDA